MSRTILIADDEPKVLQILNAYLETAGFAVVSANDGRAALDQFGRRKIDCVVLDVNMPVLDGLEVAREIRKTSDVPILFLTARVDETDRVVGLELGADDYVVKPFSPRELLARIKAVLRRYPERSEANPDASAGPDISSLIRHGDLAMDTLKHTVSARGEMIAMTKIQFDMLRLLMSEPGRVFSRSDLLESTTESGFEGYERTVDAHIKNIRKLLGDDGDNPRYIGTVRGVGYKLIE